MLKKQDKKNQQYLSTPRRGLILLSLGLIFVLSGCFNKEVKETKEDKAVVNNINQNILKEQKQNDQNNINNNAIINVDDINVKNIDEDNSKDVNNIEDKKIKLDSKFLSPFSTKAGTYVKLKIFDNNFNIKDLFNYSSSGGANSFLLNNQPYVFISGGSRGFTLIDLFGNDLSQSNLYLKDKNFSAINFIKYSNNEKKIIYSLGAINNEENKNLYIADLNGNILDYIESDKLPNSLISIRVIGWSKNGEFIYVAKIGWEGYYYANLWKVNIKSKKVEEINGINKVSLGELNVAPSLDLAVGVESKEVSCNNCMGGVQSGAPSKLNLYNLKLNNYRTLVFSEKKLIITPILAPSGNKVFYYEIDGEKKYSTYSISVEENKINKIGENLNILSVSYDGSKIIIAIDPERRKSFKAKDNIKFKLIDLSRGIEQDIIFDDLKNKNNVIKFIRCNYPLGYSCLYSNVE